VPAPVSHDTRCSDCGLPWSMHSADEQGAVASTECVRLLLVENERLRTSVPAGYPPQPWPVNPLYLYPQPPVMSRADDAEFLRTLNRLGPMPLEAPSGD